MEGQRLASHILTSGKPRKKLGIHTFRNSYLRVLTFFFEGLEYVLVLMYVVLGAKIQITTFVDKQ